MSQGQELRQDFFSALALVHENAIARWDEACIPLDDNANPHVMRTREKDGRMYWMVAVNSGARFLAGWIPNGDNSDGRWLVRGVTNQEALSISAGRPGFFEAETEENFENYGSFIDRYHTALGTVVSAFASVSKMLEPVSDPVPQSMLE